MVYSTTGNRVVIDLEKYLVEREGEEKGGRKRGEEEGGEREDRACKQIGGEKGRIHNLLRNMNCCQRRIYRPFFVAGRQRQQAGLRAGTPQM